MAEPLKSPTKGSPPWFKEEINRRGLSRSDTATNPVTPPSRFISSNYSTPGSAYGKEEDAVIIELSPRYIIAGIEDESYPQCRYDFGPNGSMRSGDYRQWLPGYHRQNEKLERWGEGYELWRNDLSDVDLGLLSDKLERTVREVYNKHLLVNAGNARLIMVVPSLLPHPVLATILQLMFKRWPYTSITLLPTPATALVAAGLRSGLVVEIGWEETVVTAVYEYREVRSHRSTRAMKMLTRNFARWARDNQFLRAEHRLDLEIVEQFLTRAGSHACEEGSEIHGPTIVLEWPTETFTKEVNFPRVQLGSHLKETWLGQEGEPRSDDEEIPLQRLIYNTLLALPPDIRGICISRMTYIGQGSNLSGLVSAIHESFTKFLDNRGWSGVEGHKAKFERQGLSELAQARAQPADSRHDDIVFSDKAITEERHLRERFKNFQPPIHGIVRCVDTLGSWAGASLLTTLKIKSFVEIQRDKFLAHGLNGASRELDLSVIPQQRMSTLGIRPKAGERTSWTLSGWG